MGVCRRTPDSSTFTRLEHWEHNPENLEVWPWVWTHPNENGPHHVFVGINGDSLLEIQRLRDESDQNNILVIASKERLEEVANANDDPGIYERCQCGLVVDSKVELLNHEAKILMLDDERVIAFDRLTLV